MNFEPEIIHNAIVTTFAGMGVGFILGYFLGYAIGKRGTLQNNEPIADPLNRFITIIVCLAWVTSVFVSMVNPNYSTPFNLHIIMGAIISVAMKVKFSDVINAFLKK